MTIFNVFITTVQIFKNVNLKASKDLIYEAGTIYSKYAEK
jgi:hypothetical protein